MRVIGRKHALSRSRINSKRAGRDRFLRLWMRKRAFMQLKAERGQNKLAGCGAAWLIWNGPDPLRLVDPGGGLPPEVGFPARSMRIDVHPSGDFSLQHTQKLSFMKLSIIIGLICIHLFTFFFFQESCCFSHCFDLKCFHQQVLSSEWHVHKRARGSAMRKLNPRGNNGSGLTANLA